MTDQNRREARDVCEPTRYKTTRMVCADCGRSYYNLWAHLEECSGKTVRQVDLTDEQVDHFKQIHDRPNR